MSQKKEIDWAKPYESACEIKAPDPALLDILNYSGDSKKRIALRDQAKVEHIIEVANELEDGEEFPNYEDSDQEKYFPIHRFVPGVGWRDGGFDGWITRAVVGSRLSATNTNR